MMTATQVGVDMLHLLHKVPVLQDKLEMVVLSIQVVNQGIVIPIMIYVRQMEVQILLVALT